jgi:hypothetical protein
MPSQLAVSRILPKAAHHAVGRVLRVVMVLSLWHAPIPWVHVHDLDGPQVERLGSLSRHIADFHARELSRGGTRLDWHAHLVLPWCLTHQHDCPADNERNPGSDDILAGAKANACSWASGQSIGQPTARAFLAEQIPADAAVLVSPGTGASATLFCQAPFRHFFESYGSSVAVRDLVSVRLC